MRSLKADVRMENILVKRTWRRRRVVAGLRGGGIRSLHDLVNTLKVYARLV